jgi:hypothetical protein
MPPLAALLPAGNSDRQNTLFRPAEPRLVEQLRQRAADALIVSGSEADVCVRATVLMPLISVTGHCRARRGAQ